MKTNITFIKTTIFWFLGIFFLPGQWLSAQPLILDSCYAMAKRNYPLVKQYNLIEQSGKYSVANASKGYLPQFSIAGQATYQSDVTEIPISLPNLNIPTISNDQYKIYGEVVEPITGLFTVKQQKDFANATKDIEKNKLEVDLYNLKDRINQLFFGILLIDEQIKQVELLKKDIQTGIDKTNAALANGVAIQSNVDQLQAELLKAGQKTIELKAARKGFADMLSLFINQPFDKNTTLVKPIEVQQTTTINRPELTLFDSQKTIYDIQSNLISIRNCPQFSLFFQSGYGRPGLDMLKNDFAFYYIGGLQLRWNLSSFYTSKKEKQLLTINQNEVDAQKETFLFNTNLQMKQQSNEITKLQDLIKTDKDIISLRNNIKNTSKEQLENGIITTNEYITYINAEDKAKQDLLLHQIQLLMAQYKYKVTTGN